MGKGVNANRKKLPSVKLNSFKKFIYRNVYKYKGCKLDKKNLKIINFKNAP